MLPLYVLETTKSIGRISVYLSRNYRVLMLMADGSSSDAMEMLALYLLRTTKSRSRISVVSGINDKPVAEDTRILAT